VDETGTWAFVSVTRPDDGPFGLKTPERRAAVNLRDGRIRDFGEYDPHADHYGHWFTGEGGFVWVEERPLPGRPTREKFRIEVDLESGRQVSIRTPRRGELLWPDFRYENGTIARRTARFQWELTLPGGERVALPFRARPERLENLAK